jgi:sulfate permease, SulP family
MSKFISFSNLKGDIFGGINAGLTALPIAIAFGFLVFSGIDAPDAIMVGAIAGITTSVLLGFLASLLGGNNALISGASAPLVIVTSAIAAFAYTQYGTLEAALSVVILSLIFCGLFQIIFGLIRIGKYIKHLPYSVFSGFLTGIGILIILLQIFPLIGMKSPSGAIAVFSSLSGIAKEFNLTSLLWGLMTIVIIYLFPFVTKKIPSTFIALIAVTALSTLTAFDPGLTIGKISSVIPELHFSIFMGLDWSIVKMAIIPGFVLACMGAIITIFTSIKSDSYIKSEHNSNRELLAQGMGNIVTAIFGGIAGSGNSATTIENCKSGGQTKLSGMIHSILLVAILLGLGQFFRYIPLSALAGVLITVGIGMIDKKALKNYFKNSKTELLAFIIVILLTIFVDIIPAVGIIMTISVLLLIKQQGIEKDTTKEKTVLNPESEISPSEQNK